MAESNVTEKSLLEKIRDLLERKQDNYDLAFCVGKEKKIVGAVKIILKASSAFLEKEFEEKWEVAGIKKRGGIPQIPLPDFDPIAFELFVKLTSLDTWSLEILKALNLPLNQILNLLSICRSFEVKTAEGNLKILVTIILESFGEYKDTDDFLQLSQTNLKYILGSDDIEITELDVFRAAIRWARFQCKQMEVKPTGKFIREVLGDCLFEIRFPIMTCAQFTEARESKDILTAEESLGINELIGLTGNKNIKRMKFDLKMLPFKTTLRNKIRWGNKIDGFRLTQRQAAVAVGNSIYSFGGDNISGLSRYSVMDVFVLNVNDRKKEWEELEVHSEVIPNRRSGHSAVAHKEFVLIFAGDDRKTGKLLNTTYRFNTLTLKWDRPKVTGKLPPSRACHSAVVLRNQMLIYGGRGIEVTNDLFSLHLESFRWSKIKTKGIPPSIRESHSATVHNDRFVLIFGGQDTGLISAMDHMRKTEGPKARKRVNTIASFDLDNKTWTAVETRGPPPLSRMEHCSFAHNGLMYIFGGNDENWSELNDIFSYDAETFEWKKVAPNGKAPSPRSIAGCVALNDQVFIFGGFNRKERYLRDTRVLQM